MLSTRTLGPGVIAAAVGLAILLAQAPRAAEAECTSEKSGPDLTQEEATALYDCIAKDMLEAYSGAEGVPGVPAYRTWKLVSTAPLVSATHGKMLVNHWVNDVGAALYTKWEEMDGAEFEVGTILAKESFRIDREGTVKLGPLFLMEKVAESEAPDGWVYTRIFTNGNHQRTNEPGSDRMVFCHDCHAATIETQDAVFFPPEAYRIPTE